MADTAVFVRVGISTAPRILLALVIGAAAVCYVWVLSPQLAAVSVALCVVFAVVCCVVETFSLSTTGYAHNGTFGRANY
jgi:hypothetical protein